MRLLPERSRFRCWLADNVSTKPAVFFWIVVLSLFLACEHPNYSMHVQALVLPSTSLRPRKHSTTISFQYPSSSDRQQLFASSSLPLLQEEPYEYEYPIPEPSRRRSHPRFRPLENFAAGFLHVESDFVHLFQEYFLKKATLVVAPWISGMVLLQWLVPVVGIPLGNSARDLLSVFHMVSSGVTQVLNAPISALVWLDSAIPASIIASLDYFPRGIALFLCSSILFVSRHIRFVMESNWSVLVNSFLLHPTIEEFQYRFVLTKSLRSVRRLVPKKKSIVDTTGLVQFIPIPTISDGSVQETGSLSIEASKSAPAASKKQKFRMPVSKLSLISSALFAMTRLCWLTPDTYSTAGFVQSAMIHLSEWSIFELKPFIHQVLVGLALHQSVTAWYLSRKVFYPLYQEGGLAASMGAHIAWTIGFLALPIRWAARGVKWTGDQIKNVSPGL